MDIIRRLKRKFDLQAIEQLQEEVARLHLENENLKCENANLEQRAIAAEHWAEFWRDDFFELQLSSYPDHDPGLTVDGRLTVVPKIQEKRDGC